MSLAGQHARRHDAGSARARFAVLRRFAETRLVAAPGWHPALRWSVATIRARPGPVAIHALAREIGWSRRHLHRMFRDQVGVERFAAALAALTASPRRGSTRSPWRSGTPTRRT